MNANLAPTAAEAALALAGVGIPIFPIWSVTGEECDCGNVDCGSPGKHPVGRASFAPNGVKSASTDSETIRAWFDTYPTANVGAACGHPLGGGVLVVLDVDPGRGGVDSLAVLEAKYGGLPRLASVTTGSGGLHVWMSAPTALSQSKDKLGPGLELKSAGGYVVAPPSLHASGRRYEWRGTFDPAVLAMVPLPDTPAWLVDLAASTQGSTAGRAEMITNGNGAIPDGARDVTLARLAGALRRVGAEQGVLEAALLGVNERTCDPPLEEHDVRRIAKSISRYPSAAKIDDGSPDWPSLSRSEVPPFPVDALPPSVSMFVEAVAELAQVPADLVAFAALGVLSAAALAGVVLDCSWGEEKLALFLIAVAPSGERKSTVLERVRQPLDKIERERREAARPDVLKQRARRRVLEKRLQNLTTQAGREDAEDRDRTEAEIETVEAELERIGDPVEPRLFADDATPEALGHLLAAHGSIAVLAAESAFTDCLLGRYSNDAPNLHLVCSSYTGERTTIDRRGHDALLLDRPLMSIAICPQPIFLAKLLGNEVAAQQGLVARFAIAVPASNLGSRRIGTNPVPEHVAQGWETTVRRVASLKTADIADKDPLAAFKRDQRVSNVSVSAPLRLRLSERAQALLDKLQRDIEPRLAANGDLRQYSAWTNRHHGRVARIAALLHLCEHDPVEPVAEATMRSAMQIGEYLLAHATVALAIPDESTRKALDWLERRGEPTVTVRELHRGPLGSRGPAKHAQTLAERLEAIGALRSLEPEHPTSRNFAVHPDLVRRDTDQTEQR